MTERDIFIAALQKDDPAERQAYLDEACARQPELRRQVDNLLRLHEGAGSFLEDPAAKSPATGPIQGVAEPPSSCEAAGTLIGPYKLLQQIGEGGMGTVFMAEQTEPVKRKVALKIIKPGMDSRQVIARFEAERQALALMDHVNIARVFDGGATEAGRPYFVMELVHGVPITKYCDDNHLTPRERLELFVPVCQAIQHAHQKGIIHRDVKPSNVMVTLYDGKPVPKVIDFGVAKATEQKLTERTLFTQYGTMVGTLEYMSPEQAEMSALGVDTRSDIYSLGVLLYELLTGSTPLTHKRMKEAAYAEILRMIKEVEPPKPSTRLSDSGEALASISANRHTEPAKLTKLVKGELDWIVMKSLEKDRSRRYETANGFAMDVQRYLTDEPVLACPPSKLYRMRKFLRRHRGPAIAAALVLLTLLGGIIGTTWGMLRARAASQRAEAKTQLARRAADDMYSQVAEQWLTNAPFMTKVQRAFLFKALELYKELAKEQGDDPDVRFETGRAYRRVGHIHSVMEESDLSLDAYRRAAGILQALTKEFPGNREYRRELCQVHIGQGYRFREEDRFQESEQSIRDALKILDRIVAESPGEPEDQRWLAEAHRNLGLTQARTKRPDEAEKSFRQALAVQERLPDTVDNKLAYAMTLGDLSELLSTIGHVSEAMRLAQQVIEIIEEQEAKGSVPPAYRNTLAAFHNGRAGMLLDEGRTDEAEKSVRKSLDIRIKLRYEFPVAYMEIALARTYNNYARLLAHTGRAQESKAAFEKAIAFQESVVANNPTNPSRRYDLAVRRSNLACLLATCADPQVRDPAAAVRHAESAIKLLPTEGEPWNTVSTGVKTLYYRSRDQKARVAAIWNTLGVARYRLGNWPGALEALNRSMQLYCGGDAFDWLFLAMTHWQLGDKDQARERYTEAVKWMEKNNPADEELRRFRSEAAELLGIRTIPE